MVVYGDFCSWKKCLSTEMSPRCNSEVGIWNKETEKGWGLLKKENIWVESE
jgi:hypothetical protein